MTSNKRILALGADIKNRFLFADYKSLYFSRDIGDLSDVENYEFFKRAIEKIIKKDKPDIIACDLHPNYFSSQFAKALNLKLKTYNLKFIQHHHAHIASVIEEHGLKKPVIGVSFDGTGFGTDGNMWGGEFLLVDKKRFKRLAHLKYHMMPGGEKVVKEPWRMALSILGGKAVPFLKGVERDSQEMVLSMMKKNINSPFTSSAGRLFDAAAAILGICLYASYEAEGPVKLEAMRLDDVKESYDFKMTKDKSGYIIDAKPAFLGIIRDLKKAKDKAIIATKFHNTMVDVITETAKKLSSKLCIKDVALSGGVFQNKFLRDSVTARLKSLKFNVYINEKLPVNDLNIALGQYYVSCGAGKD